MKNLIFILLLLTPFLFTQCGGSKKSTKSTAKSGVKFIESNSQTLTSVLEKAEREGKIVFIDFYTTWCQPCKMMDQDVFPNKEIANFFNKNFINFKVNAEKGNGSNIAALYDVKAYPTLVWIDAKGRVLEKTEGGTYHTKLRQLAENALANQGN